MPPIDKEEKKKRPPPLEKKEDDEGGAGADEWIPMQSRSQGRPYYYHTETRETTWDMPRDYDDNLPDDAPGWIEMESRTQGRYYYYNERTRECTWDRPSGVEEPPPFERRKPNPKREALRDVIQDWADEFYQKHDREPTEEDIPPGEDIARHHRDYKMLKNEEEVDRLKNEQKKLREALDPETRPRLVEIKDALQELEPKVAGWQETKKKERARREEVTQTYNTWIKDFTEKNGQGPTEKDITSGSEIETMFAEYQKYREEAKRAKARAARIEEKRERLKHEQDQAVILQYMGEYEKKHGKKPTQRDLPEGSEIAQLYQAYIEREMKLNPDSPNSKVERVRREINDWSKKFEDVHGRKPTRSDIKEGTKIKKMCDQYDDLLAERAGLKSDRPSTGTKPAAAATGAKTGGPSRRQRSGGYEENLGAEQSPRSYAQYQRDRPGGQPGACADCCTVM